ncbi:MAG: hypothetical protein MPN21_22415 [Thermoanaerobaculia bacterium]|nr:hypothetical protein [Thermoanaerobaculia bacterium]
MSDESVVALGGASWRDEPDARSTEPVEDGGGDPNQEPRSDPDEVDDGPPAATKGLSPVDIRNFSVKCAYCGSYQVIVRFRNLDEDWNEYTYECDQPPCSAEVERTRTVLEIPTALDVFARRDPTWHGGKVHAGAQRR